jgi:hypothetical protein
MEAGAWARRLEVKRAGASSVHAVSGGDVVRTRGGEALTAVGASARGVRESEAGVRERPGWLALVGRNGAAAR